MKKTGLVLVVVVLFVIAIMPVQASADDETYTAGDLIIGGLLQGAKALLEKKEQPKPDANDELAQARQIIIDNAAKAGVIVSPGEFYERKEISSEAYLLTFKATVDGAEKLVSVGFCQSSPGGAFVSGFSTWWNTQAEYHSATNKLIAAAFAHNGFDIGPVYEDQPQQVRAAQQQPEQTRIEQQQPPAAVKSPAEKLAELKKMMQDGLITKADYDAKKAEILSKM
jgi:hypothetical protein